MDIRQINEKRLQATLKYIGEYQLRYGKSPTYRQIQKECGHSSLSCVAADVVRLKERGQIESENGTGWKGIKTPSNIRTESSHNAVIVGAVRCGEPAPAIEDIEASVALPDAIFGKAEHVILHAKGPSMIKRGIFDGDLLVVRRQKSANYGDTVIAITCDGETTCKILAKKKGMPYLMAANDEKDGAGRRKYDVFPHGEWEIYGIVDYVIHAPVRNEY